MTRVSRASRSPTPTCPTTSPRKPFDEQYRQIGSNPEPSCLHRISRACRFSVSIAPSALDRYGDVSLGLTAQAIISSALRAFPTPLQERKNRSERIRCAPSKPSARISSPIRNTRFGSSWDARGDNNKADRRPEDRESVDRSRRRVARHSP
jgi:hypothetical protein